tara:strand:+ start:717 stop:869 length:153 start_codon:yes stop_codon:yes gene_type:complete
MNEMWQGIVMVLGGGLVVAGIGVVLVLVVRKMGEVRKVHDEENENEDGLY